MENSLFDVSQSLGCLGILLHNQILLPLKLRHLLDDEEIEHLLLQPERSDGEVEEGYFHLGFWCVMWVR